MTEAPQPHRLPHEWDDDACCIHCGHDGAESRHLVQVAGYELTDEDRWCEIRERKARDAGMVRTLAST